MSGIDLTPAWAAGFRSVEHMMCSEIRVGGYMRRNCLCGHALPWADYERAWDEHRLSIAAPLIEVAVREQVAQEIEAARATPGMKHADFREGLEVAARIARLDATS